MPLVKLLWMFGADFTTRDSEGNTPIDIAHPKMKQGLKREFS